MRIRRQSIPLDAVRTAAGLPDDTTAEETLAAIAELTVAAVHATAALCPGCETAAGLAEAAGRAPGTPRPATQPVTAPDGSTVLFCWVCAPLYADNPMADPVGTVRHDPLAGVFVRVYDDRCARLYPWLRLDSGPSDPPWFADDEVLGLEVIGVVPGSAADQSQQSHQTRQS